MITSVRSSKVPKEVTFPFFDGFKNHNLDTGVHVGSTSFWVFIRVKLDETQPDLTGTTHGIRLVENDTYLNDRGFSLQLGEHDTIETPLLLRFNSGTGRLALNRFDIDLKTGADLNIGIYVNQNSKELGLVDITSGEYSTKSRIYPDLDLDLSSINTVVAMGIITSRNVSGIIRNIALGEGQLPTKKEWLSMYDDAFQGKYIQGPGIIFNRMGINQFEDKKGDGAVISYNADTIKLTEF